MVQPQHYAGLSLRMREYENPASFTSIDNSYQVRHSLKKEAAGACVLSGIECDSA
jgi:hypothetical protein